MSTIQFAKTRLQETEFAQLQQTVSDILQQAKQLGATATSVAADLSCGYEVNVRLGEVDKLEYVHNKGIGITVYFDQKKGSSYTTDTHPDAIEQALKKACTFANYTEADQYAGIPEKAYLALSYPDLDLYHPWDLSPEDAIHMAKQCEQMGMSQDKRINNSEGVSIDNYEQYSVLANSHGFFGECQSTRHGVSCILLAADECGMERDYSYTLARAADDLLAIDVIAKEAAVKTVGRLGAKRIATGKYPVIFQAEVARSLLTHLFSAIKGSSLYHKASFLLDQLGKAVLSDHIDLIEKPFLLKGLGSAPFDGEGVKTKEGHLVKQGVLQSYLLNSYAARRLNMQPTGHAGGVHNVFLMSQQTRDFTDLLKMMDSGLLVTDVMGHGINIVTGDYSRGVSGFWVEKGEIQYPVHELTVAGNLKEMFQQIVAIGNDTNKRNSIQTGSMLIESMTVAGE